jgi:hypothetical protein
MKTLTKLIAWLAAAFLLLIAAFDLWGALTLGTITPDDNAARNPLANRVVLVTGATGSAGDGLLKAAIESPEVAKVHVITRRSSDRIDAGVASGKVQVHLHKDFTDYSNLTGVLAEVDTVLWGLGTSSLQVDDETYTMIHVDFPLSFIDAWQAARAGEPRSFHFVTGMGTDPDSDTHWAREKGRTERTMADRAAGTGLRTFSYRSAWIRPTSENANLMTYLGELLLIPGKLVIPGKALGDAMLEISARTGELPNGTLIDNADSIAYAALYQPGVTRSQQ